MKMFLQEFSISMITFTVESYYYALQYNATRILLNDGVKKEYVFQCNKGEKIGKKIKEYV